MQKPCYWALALFLMLWGDQTLKAKPTSNELSPTLIPLLLELRCNGENTQQIIYALRDEGNEMWVGADAVKMCQIPMQNEVKTFQGNSYISLNRRWISYLYDASNLTLNILVPSQLRPRQKFILNKPQFQALRPKHPGGYVNYDLSVQRNDEENVNHYAALTDFVYFNYFGVGHACFLTQHDEDRTELVRLNTTWTLDKPEKFASWRFGDSITGTEIWTGAVQFAGIQYATNFATQPGFVTFPLPSFKGQAIIPTTVEFFINNQLRAAEQVRSGSYIVEGLPIINGGNEVVVHTTDILGRQTIATLPYYVSQEFLQPGLIDFSYEMGIMRRNFGIESNDYADFLLVGSYQQGLTESWTAGWHGEFLSEQQTFGVNSSHVIARYFELDLAAAGSQSHHNLGGLLLVGLQRNGELYSLGGQAIATSHHFCQIGLQDISLAPKLLLQTNASIDLKKWGSMGISYTERMGRTEPNIDLTTIFYNKTLHKNLFFTISYLHQGGLEESNSLGIFVVWVPKQDYTTTAGYDHRTEYTGATVSLSKNLPTDNGYGFRLLGVSGDNSFYEADFAAQNQHGRYQAIFSHIGDSHNYEIDVSGGLVSFDKKYFFTRKIDDSFILAIVPNIENVRVYWSNQLIGRTDKEGYLFIPHALPYNENSISINPEDLPLNTTLDTDRLRVYPYFRSGALVQFPIEHVYNIVLQLEDDKHEPIPAGALVTIDQGLTYPVGYEGKVFISQRKINRILKGIANWDQQQCGFSVPLPNEENVLMDVGTLSCYPVD